MHKDYRKIVRELRKQGFTVDETSKSYATVYDPDGNHVTRIASTPSDSRHAIHNFIARCRRAGFIWPAK